MLGWFREDAERASLETFDAIGIGGKVMTQYLDRDGAPEPRVAGAIDLTHTARADGSNYFVRSQACPGIE